MRQQVTTFATAAAMAALNDFMVGLFGDDPGSEEITLNAYLDGADPSAATHSFGVANCSQADADSIGAYTDAVEGTDSAAYPASGPMPGWDVALARWGLKPVVPHGQ